MIHRRKLCVIAAAASLVGAAFGAPVLAADALAPAGRWTEPMRSAAATPPMGWNSWNAFRTEINEDKVIGAAQTLVDTGLARLGYSYVNIDDGWWMKRRSSDGRLEIRTAIFPSAAIPGKDTSFRPLVDRLHGMGLKAGIYTDIGHNACSQAWDLHSPNLPVGTAAEREVGLEGHVEQDIQLFFNDWGFDYVKVDACGVADFVPGSKKVQDNGYNGRSPLIMRSNPTRDDAAGLETLYAKLADAMGRLVTKDYILSICTWGRGDVRAWGPQHGHLWRTSADIGPSWSSMLHVLDTVTTRPLYAGPGRWNDPDMLFVGTGDFDVNHLTQARSHFSLWAIVNAPLLIGYDLRGAPQSLLDIWGNADVVAINQDKAGHQGVLAYRSDDVQILVKTLSDGRKAAALFNRSDKAAKITLTAAHLKFDAASPMTLKNLWSKATTEVTGEQTFDVAPYETLLFTVSGKPVTGGAYLSEIPGLIHVAVDGVRDFEVDPEVHELALGRARGNGEWPQYGGWGGAQADASPYSTQLAIGDEVFRYGLGVLSDSRLEVMNQGQFARFSATVGVDTATRNRAARVIFEVYGDGRLLAKSPAMAFTDAAVELNADTRSVKVIELIARSDAPSAPAAVAWGDARLLN